MPLYSESERQSEIITSFREACKPTLRQEEYSNTIQLLFEIAVEMLEDALHGGASRIPGDRAAQESLTAAFLSRYIELHMQAATNIAAQKSKREPEVMEARLRRAISQMPLNRIVKDVLAGKGKNLRAPRSIHPTGIQLGKLSVIKS